MKCPTCDKNFDDIKSGKKNGEKKNERPKSWPFCSKRCKMVDLGKWVNEEYKIPIKQAPNEEDLQELEQALISKN